MFCIWAASAAAQHVESDSTWYATESGNQFRYTQTDYVDGSFLLKKERVSIVDTYRAKLAELAENLDGIYNSAEKTNARILKTIRENARVANQTGTNLLDTASIAAQAGLAGTWNVLDFDRASTLTITYNAANSNLKWNGTAGATISVISPTIIYLKNWKTAGLLLFTRDGGATWADIERKIILSK